MAMRRPPADVVPPCELARFDPDEWPAPDDAPAPDVSWYPAYERWMAARRAWVKRIPIHRYSATGWTTSLKAAPGKH